MGGGGEVLPETPLSPFWVESPWKCGAVILSEIIAAAKCVHRNNTERERGALLRGEILLGLQLEVIYISFFALFW